MKKYNVLIFPAGTEIAFEIQNALKYSKFVNLFGANSMPSHAEFVFKKCVTDLPLINDEHFIDALNRLIDQWSIDYVYPAHDCACFTLTKERERIHAEIVTSPFRTVDVCRSKNKTYKFFSEESFLPEFYNSAEEIKTYPVFVKPSVGQGSQGARIVETEAELLEVLKSGIEYAICEYLPGAEYTVDCFTDRHGRLRVCHLRQRERVRTGISVRSSLIPTDERIIEIARTINTKLVFIGAWFFQVKKNTCGEYRLMEISPRIPGTMGTSRNLGINYPLLTLYNLWGYDIDVIDNNLDITLDRAFVSRYKTNLQYSKVYIDFDDTLYLEDKVNIQVISFLYQCVNNKIPIILLTKHRKNLNESLLKYRISKDLFSEVIQIPQEANKSDYIDDYDCILIDDSFSERKHVKEKCKIPVYDLDMVESLIDWRI